MRTEKVGLVERAEALGLRLDRYTVGGPGSWAQWWLIARPEGFGGREFIFGPLRNLREVDVHLGDFERLQNGGERA